MDTIAYRAAFAVERQCYKVTMSDGRTKDYGNKYVKTYIVKKLLEKGYENDFHYTIQGYKQVEDVSHLYHVLAGMMKRILIQFGTKKHKGYLSDNTKNTFRANLAVTEGPRGVGYKAGRPEKPTYLKDARTYLLDRYDCEISYGLEADDALGICGSKNKNKVVLVHQDKDINMVPGLHYDPITGDSYETCDPGFLISKEPKVVGGGLAWFYFQMLTGDSIDNIPGIGKLDTEKLQELGVTRGSAGLGPMTALSILPIGEEEEMVKFVYDLYVYKFGKDLGTARFFEVCDLLWILRDRSIRKSDELRELLGDRL